MSDHNDGRRRFLRAALGALAGGSAASWGCRALERASDVKEITIWTMWSGQEERNFERVLRRYEERNPRVRFHNLGAVNDDAKTIRALVAGVPPDIFTLADAAFLGPFARSGALRPLDDLFRQSELREESFIPASLRLCRYQGRLYGLPYLIDDCALLWDKRAFAQAGLDPERPPHTLEELADYALRLTTRDGEGHITRLGLKPLNTSNWDYPLLMNLHGGRLYDPQTGRVTPDEPANIRAIEWAKSLVDRLGGIEQVNAFASGFGREQGISNPFYIGKVAMMFNGEWNPYWLSRYAPQMEYGVAPAPPPAALPERRNCTWLGGNVFCIPVACRYPKECWEFLVWTQTLEAQILFARAMNNVPNQRTALTHPQLRTGTVFRRKASVYFELADSPNAGNHPVLPVTNLYINQLSTAIDRVMYGERAATEALAEVRVRVQKELDRS